MKGIQVLFLLGLSVFVSHVFAQGSTPPLSPKEIPILEIKSAVENFCDENSWTLNLWGKTDYSHGNSRGKLDTNNSGYGLRYNCTKHLFVGGDYLQNPTGDKVTLAGVGLHGTAFSLGDFDFGGGIILLDMHTTAPKVEVKKELFPDAPFIRKTVRVYKTKIGGVYEVPFLEASYNVSPTLKVTLNVAPLPASKNKTSGEIYWIGITTTF